MPMVPMSGACLSLNRWAGGCACGAPRSSQPCRAASMKRLHPNCSRLQGRQFRRHAAAGKQVNEGMGRQFPEMKLWSGQSGGTERATQIDPTTHALRSSWHSIPTSRSMQWRLRPATSSMKMLPCTRPALWKACGRPCSTGISQGTGGPWPACSTACKPTSTPAPTTEMNRLPDTFNAELFLSP